MNVPSDHRPSRQIAERAPFQLSFEFFPPKTDVMVRRSMSIYSSPNFPTA